MRDEERVAEILAAWAEAQERGEAADPDALIRDHPDLAEALRDGFAALDLVDLALGKAAAFPAHVAEKMGPYRIEALLGTGGMGTVYRAVVERPVLSLDVGARVALKVIHPHLLRAPGFYKRFLREADLGRRVDHASVVRTYDVDALEADGQVHHFLVMEYVEGQTLRDLLDEVDRAPEALCRHIGREVAKGLQAIHEAGAIHRDLKPENVLITPDQVVKVMDLGVARLADEQVRLSRTGVFVGSILYAAPEQFESVDLDARSDLYALGLLLYEVATGRHPYRDDDLAVVMRRQMEARPRRAGEVNPQLSPYFEEVCHTLLAKDRDARLASAGALLRVLEDAEEGPWWAARAEAIRTETQRPLRRIRVARDTTLHGRREDLEALRRAYDAATTGDGNVLLLEGEAGIGKTRIVDEFVRRLEAEGEQPHFLYGAYAPGSMPSGAGAYGDALRDHFGPQGLEDALAERLADTPELIRSFLALLRGEHRPDGSAPLTTEASRALIARLVQSLAAERPTIVMIDDLHFAPPEHRALFTALALAMRSHRALLLGAFRPGVPAEWVGHVQKTAQAARRGLARLGPQDLVRMLHEALGSERLAEELAGKVGAKSDGNPYFVFEILKDLREQGLLVEQEDGSWSAAKPIHQIQIPSTILDLIDARLAALAPDERDLIEIAACMGFAFDPTLVGEAAGQPRLAALRTLSRIERRHGILRAAGRSFVFDHHQVQEALYEGLALPLREEYHRAIARALEARNGGRATARKDADGALALRLCSHHQRGGEGRLARPYLARALKHLGSASLHVDALELIDRALGDGDSLDDRERLDLLGSKAERLERLGRSGEDRKAREEAVALAEQVGDIPLRAAAHWMLGHHLERIQASAGALDELLRAIELAQACGDESTEMRARSCRGHVLRHLGRAEDARVEYRRQLGLAQALGDRSSEARARGNLGLLEWDQGRYDEALALHRQSLDLACALGETQTEARSAGNLGLVCWNLGRYEEAEAWHRRDLALSAKLADRWGEMAATGNLGLVLHATGRLDEARRHYTRMRDMAVEIGDSECESYAVGNLGSAERDLGHLAASLACAEAHRALAEERGHRAGQAMAHHNLGTLYVALGDEEQARGHLGTSLDVARAIGDRRHEAEALHTLADLAREGGDATRAESLHAEALAIRAEIGDAAGAAESRLGLARDRALRGDAPGAREMLEAVLAGERERPKGGAATLALGLRAVLTAGDARDARAALAECGDALPEERRMEACFLLWRATGDPDPLRESGRILDHLVQHAPERCRASMIANVSLHRDIRNAEAARETEGPSTA